MPSSNDQLLYAQNSLIIPPSRSQAVLKKALEYSKQASDAMWRHILIVLGIMLYISFIVMSTVFYYPSYYACMVRSGTLWSLSNAIVNAVFMVFLVMYVSRQFFDSDTGTSGNGTISSLQQFIQGFDQIMPGVLGLCVTFLVISYGTLFFKCRDDPNCPGCTPTQATTFNTLVTNQVNRSTPQLQTLLEFYTDYSKDRINIALCKNYYSDAYLNISQNSQGTAQCGAADDSKGLPTIVASQPNVKPDSVPGAPLLNQFYVMTSGRTCVVNNQYDSYMSPAMIRIALTGGARCLDFEVTNYASKQKSFPIVTNARNRDNKNLQHNFVLFEDVLRTVVSEWVEPHQNMEYPADPLFLRFVLDTALTQNSMDQMAYLLQYYLNEQAGSHLLPNVMNYKSLAQSKTNIGNLPLAYYYGYIVIMVYTPCASVTRQFEKSMLAELTNALCTVPANKRTALGTIHSSDDNGDFSVFESSYVQSIVPKSSSSGDSKSSVSAYNSLIRSNTQSISYVETSFTPYSTVDTSPGTGCFDPTKTYHTGDAMTTLLLNKLTINNSPVPGVRTGCQFIAMNFQDISDDMKTYLAMFNKSSFILKPKSLWNENMFGEPPPPLSTCSTNDIAYTNDRDPLYCYQFCLNPSQKWTANNVQNTTPGKSTKPLGGRFVKLTSENSSTNTCIKPGYVMNPAVEISANVQELGTDGSLKNTRIAGTVFSKSQSRV